MIRGKGTGFVNVPDSEEDVVIEKENLGFALDGDIVEIKLQKEVPGKRREAVVTGVVERSFRELIGVVKEKIVDGKKLFYFSPDNHRIHVRPLLPNASVNDLDMKVAVEISSWPIAQFDPVATIIETLGRNGDHETEMQAIIRSGGFTKAFPEVVQQAAHGLYENREQIFKDAVADPKRRDMRGVTTMTIDPVDAKDFDDALSFKKLENGNYEIGIHIADVSHYLLPETPLEKEAYLRATSVYLVDRTIPMLPEKLSNELCSLRPNEEKLCFSAVFELSENAELRSSWFGRTVIYSDRRFTYEEAQEIIETGEGDYSKEVLHLDKLAKILRAERFRHGAIDFNTEEVKFKLDEMGKPIGVTIKKMKDSNQLIEEFMLLANRKVGEFIGKKKAGEQEKTFVYRIHDKPDDGRVLQLKTFVKHLGYKIGKAQDKDSTRLINDLMEQLKGHAEEDIIKQMAIRTMAKAEYSTNNIGHYGLAFEYYSHFTSPIRRYPDVMAHRLLQHYLDGGKSVNANDYDVRCKHSSLMEKRASDAERASIKYKQVEYMLEHTGEIFAGIISGLTSWGFYVEVGETKSEGMIALRNLSDDHYEFNADKYIIRGLRTGVELHMGDKVMVKVMGGNLNQRTLDFQWVR